MRNVRTCSGIEHSWVAARQQNADDANQRTRSGADGGATAPIRCRTDSRASRGRGCYTRNVATLCRRPVPVE